MLQPFIWMFKAENFWKRLTQLAGFELLFIILAGLFFAFAFFLDLQIQYKILCMIISGICFVCAWFLIQGYFWNVTKQIISRKADIMANNIYSGKVKQVFIIDLPGFEPFKFIWRGFASMVASILMVLPYVLLFYISIFNSCSALAMNTYMISLASLLLLFFIFLPAMLWNYADKNSVTAVWDIRKAYYLLEAYPLRYIFNTVLFLVFYLFNAFIQVGLYMLLELLFKPSAAYIAVSIFAYVQYLYTLHVYAYLLGTISGTEDG